MLELARCAACVIRMRSLVDQWAKNRRCRNCSQVSPGNGCKWVCGKGSTLIRSGVFLFAVCVSLAACDNAKNNMHYPVAPVILIAKTDDFPMGSDGVAAQRRITKITERALQTRFPKVRWDSSEPILRTNQAALLKHYESLLSKDGWTKMPPVENGAVAIKDELTGWHKDGHMFALLLWSPYKSDTPYIYAELFSSGLSLGR
jgi:hypothetical protein